ncbi:MAG: hypothetical protein IKB08_08640, partial [Clostridia bacterium]|nr:hypothetical protein [Clostridia bacterium]
LYIQKRCLFVRSELKQRNYKGWYIKLLRASEGLEATTSEATEEATGEKLEALGGTTREEEAELLHVRRD